MKTLYFVFGFLLLLFTVLFVDETAAEEPSLSFLGPEIMTFADESEKVLCILETDAKRIDFYDLDAQKSTAAAALSQTPNQMQRTGNRLFVACGFLSGEVVEIDVPTRKIVRRWCGIHSPWGVAFSENGIGCTSEDGFHGDLLVLDASLSTTEERIPYEKALLQTIPVVREPVAFAMTPDEKELFVANMLPLSRSNGSTVSSCFSILDLETHAIRHRQLVDGCGNLRDITISPDGRYVFMVHTHGNHRTITSQLFGGWTNRNGFSIYDRKTDS